MRLYLVKLTDVNWDTYDAAIIGCESKQKLEEMLLTDKVFDKEDARGLYKGRSPRVEYPYDFDIGRWQKVESIEAVGFSDYETDKEAVVFLASFNAG